MVGAEVTESIQGFVVAMNLETTEEELRQVLCQIVDLQFSLRVVPVIDPIHHSEQRISRHGQIYRPLVVARLLHFLKNPAREFCVFVFAGRDVRVQIAAQRLGFVRQHFHLRHVRGEERKVVLDEQAEFGNRIFYFLQLLLQAFEDVAEAVVLD